MQSTLEVPITTSKSSASIVPLRLTAIVFTLTLFIYSLTTYIVRPQIGPTGDEPHYLIVVSSIVRDFDLDVRNNYQDHHWKAFYGGDLGWQGHAFDYFGDGKLTTIHPIGMPVFLAVPYLLASKVAELLGMVGRSAIYAGYLGAVAAMVLVSAALATIAFQFVLDVVGKVSVAFLSWALVFFVNPLLPYSSQLFPEMLRGAALTTGLWIAWRGFTSWFSWIVAALCVALLPWFHFRYAGLAVVLGAYIIGRGWQTRRSSVVLVLAATGLSLTGLSMYSAYAYGSFSPTAAYKFFGDPLSLKILPVGFVGTFIDQSHGLFAYAPAYLIVLIAWIVLIATGSWGRHWILVVAWIIFFVETIFSAAHPTWDGGWAIPSRFLVPVLPLAVLPLGVWIARGAASATRGASLAVLATLFLLSFAILAYTIPSPDRYYNNITSKLLIVASRDIQRFTGTKVLLNDYWPMMVSDSPFHYRPLTMQPESGVGAFGKDRDSPYGESLYLDPSLHKPGFAAVGPYVMLRSGLFSTWFFLKTDDVESSDVEAVVDTSLFIDKRPQPQARREIRGNDFGQPNVYQAFEIEFNYDGLEPIETRVLYTGKAKLWLGGISLIRRSPSH